MDYTVDPDELRTVARGLESVQSAIDAMGRATGAAGTAGIDPAVVGAAAVVDALREVGSNWSKARARIRAEVEGAARGVDAAARSYAGVESVLVRALEP
jgi:PE family protein